VKSDPTNSKSDNKAKGGTPGTAKLKLLVEVPKPRTDGKESPSTNDFDGGSSTGDLDEETATPFLPLNKSDNAEDGFAVPKPRTDGKESPSTTPLGDPENSKPGKKRKRRQLVKSGGSSTDEETPTPFLPLNKSDNAEDGFAVPKPRTRLVKPTSSTSDNKAKGGTPGTAKLKLLVEVPTDGKESPSTSTDDFDGGSSTDEETPTPFLPPNKSAHDSDGGTKKQIRSSERIAKKSKEKASEADDPEVPEKVEEKENERKENERKAAKKLTDAKFKLAAEGKNEAKRAKDKAAKKAKDEAKIAKDEAKIAKDEANKRANQAKVDLKTAETIGNLKTAHSQMKILLKSAKEDYHRVDKRNRDMAKEIEAAKKPKTEVDAMQVPELLSGSRNELRELLTELKVMHGGFKQTQVDIQTEKIVTAVEKNKPVELAEVMKSIVYVQKSMFDGMSSVIKSVVPTRDHHEEKASPVVAPAVVCIKDLEGKKLSKWTVEDVQRWLDHSNQPGLRPLAGKNYVDGVSLILLGDNPGLCSDIWPSLSAFEKIRIQQSIVQCRAAYEHL
jgi:hypothetical protein